MNSRELPQEPGMWTEIQLSKLPFLPEASGMQKMQALSPSLQRNTIRNHGFLPSTTSVAVVAIFYGGLFGGPVSQVLKCFTAIKICDELARQGISAAPVCWIQSPFLLDHKSELHILELTGFSSEGFSAQDSLPWNQIAPLLKQIEVIGDGTFDSEILEILQNAYCPGATFFSATAYLVKALMREWGMLVVEAESPARQHALLEGLSRSLGQRGKIPSCLIPSLEMPVIAAVVDSDELLEYEQAYPVFAELGLPQPVIWPQCSATILDSRSRRTLDRFNLDLQQLYLGEDAAMEIIKENMRYSAPDTLLRLQEEVLQSTAELRAPDFHGNELAEPLNACKEKVTYQLEKLRRQCNRAIAIKEDTARRRLHRACNALAPNGRSQEQALSGIQIPLRYSRAGLRLLYEKLDIWKFKHQQIEME
jgi:uncharacterized protein YllA (UPF0747 family)